MPPSRSPHSRKAAQPPYDDDSGWRLYRHERAGLGTRSLTLAR